MFDLSSDHIWLYGARYSWGGSAVFTFGSVTENLTNRIDYDYEPFILHYETPFDLKPTSGTLTITSLSINSFMVNFIYYIESIPPTQSPTKSPSETPDPTRFLYDSAIIDHYYQSKSNYIVFNCPVQHGSITMYFVCFKCNKVSSTEKLWVKIIFENANISNITHQDKLIHNIVPFTMFVPSDRISYEQNTNTLLFFIDSWNMKYNESIVDLKCYDIPQTFKATPSQSPTSSPTLSPTESPQETPTESPTLSPTESPHETPTESSTSSPTESPTQIPIESLTDPPTESQTFSETSSDDWPSETIVDFSTFTESITDTSTIEISDSDEINLTEIYSESDNQSSPFALNTFASEDLSLSSHFPDEFTTEVQTESTEISPSEDFQSSFVFESPEPTKLTDKNATSSGSINKNNKSSKTKLIAIICAVVAVLLIATVVAVVLIIKKKNLNKKDDANQGIETKSTTFVDNTVITNNDSEDKDLNFWM